MNKIDDVGFVAEKRALKNALFSILIQHGTTLNT